MIQGKCQQTNLNTTTLFYERDFIHLPGVFLSHKACSFFHKVAIFISPSLIFQALSVGFLIKYEKFREAFHKSVKPSQRRFFNRYMVPFITEHFIAIFQMYPWVFHCDFSLDTQYISLQFFIVIFHQIPSAFHCIFSLHTLRISLWFFKCIPGYFIVIFQQIPTAFLCGIFKCSPWYFIVIFQMQLWMFHCIFHMDAWHFQ